MQTHSSLDQIEPVSKADTEISFLLSSCYLSQLEALMFLPAALQITSFSLLFAAELNITFSVCYLPVSFLGEHTEIIFEINQNISCQISLAV